MQSRLLILATFCLLVNSGCQQHATTSDSSPPNLLIILTDDMGYGDVGHIGNSMINTPHLDQLAETSVQFKYFYVSPVCAPTRASLLTGRYHQRTGVRSVTNGFETIDPDEVTLAEILKSAGYRTGIFGKWHLGEYYPSVPNAQGFDEYLGFRTGHTNYYYDAEIEYNGQPYQTTGHITEVLTDAALNFMDQQQDDPFFCYLAYNAPHTPLQVDSSWWESYLSAGLAEREARIYGMIEQIDHEIGRIMDALADADKLDNTMVIFMSDNGPINGWRVPQEEMRFNAGLRDQKFTTYEGGIRTQCYWRWEKHWAPGLRKQVAAHIDVLPTITDILEIETSTKDPSIDGISLRQTLEGTGTTDDNQDARVFFQKYSLETLRNPAPFPGGVAIRGPWKMVNGEALYHLEQDVGETNNQAANQREIFEQLKAAYLEWYQDISDDRGLTPINITVGHPQENPVYLQPHHATASGHVKFWGNRGLTGQRRGTHPNGVDSDWTGEWQSESDALEWEVNMVQSGNYSFQVMARDTTSGSIEQLSMQLNDQPLQNSPQPYTMSPEWMPYELGMGHLDQGPNRLKLVLEDDLSTALEIRALVVKKE